MKRSVWSFVAVALLSVVPAARATSVADLNTDWSDTSNPNTASFGSWSYRQGTSLLPHVADWTPLGAATPQPAWAPGTATGDFLPAEFKATSSQLNWLTGDIVVHTTDPFNGDSNGPANFLWSSPITSTVTISGSVFEGRVTPGRDNTWSLLVNGVVVSSGTLIAGDGHDRSNPFLFSNGSGGAAALIQNVTAGSTIDLQIAETATSAAGDFVGVNLHLVGVAAAVPEPASVVMMGLGVVGLACHRRLRCRRTHA